MNRLRNLTFLFLAMVFTLASCEKDENNVIPLENNQAGQHPNYVLGDQTREIGSEWEKYIDGVVTDSILTLSSTSGLELPKVGMILLKSDITDKFPRGFLGKVIEIEGNKIVTKRIELTEAFKELTIHLDNSAAMKSPAMRAAPVDDADLHINPSLKFGADFQGTFINKDREKSFASANGYAGIEGQLLIDIVIHNHKWEYQRYGAKIEAKLSASIEAKLKIDNSNNHIGQIKIATKQFTPLDLGPVIVVPEYALYAGMKAEGSVSLEGKLEYSVPIIVGSEKYGNGQWQKLESEEQNVQSDNLFSIKGKISGLIGVGLINDFRAMVYDVFGPDVKEENILAFRTEFECDAAKALSGELYDAFKDSKGELVYIFGGGVGVVAQIPFTNLEWYWEKIWEKEFSIVKLPLLPKFNHIGSTHTNANEYEIKYALPSGNTLFNGQYGIMLLDQQGNILTKQYYNSEPLKISELGTAIPVFTANNVSQSAFYVCPVYKLWGIEFVDYKSKVRLGLTENIQNIIPDEYIEILEDFGLVVHDGINPPNIEGTYLATPLDLVQNNTGGNIADMWDMYVTFTGQNNTNLTVDANYTLQAYQGWLVGNTTMSSSGPGSFIVGEGKKFTVFVDGTREESGYTAKTVEVFSGEISETGIINYQWAVIMVDDKGDPLGHWIDNKQGYLKKDSDGFSERVNQSNAPTRSAPAQRKSQQKTDSNKILNM